MASDALAVLSSFKAYPVIITVVFGGTVTLAAAVDRDVLHVMTGIACTAEINFHILFVETDNIFSGTVITVISEPVVTIGTVTPRGYVVSSVSKSYGFKIISNRIQKRAVEDI